MSAIDFILNLAGLLLWLNWRSLRFDPLARTSAASLVGTLRKADPSGPKRWKFLAALAALLFIRALLYWEIGPAMEWTPNLQLGPIALSFRSDFLGRMLLFSALSFGITLAVFYLWLLLLSLANRRVADLDPLQKLVRQHLGWIEPWPNAIKSLLPLFLAGLCWLLLHPLLTHLALIPKAKSWPQIIEEAAVIGLGTYLSWKYLIAVILALHLLNSYVYLGNHPLWSFINTTARNLLVPLRWGWLPLRVGRLDFAPVAGVALVFLISYFATPMLTALYQRLPL
ncbi:MAG: hypothetical protein JWR19_3381 [Pedosphaera sp.]|nr:hypothetical protein [Pedosphaera sp.]